MSNKIQERLMCLSGFISYIKHSESEKEGPNKGKVIKNSYVTLDIIGGQLNFPLDYSVASTLSFGQQVLFQFRMKARFLNGQHSPYIVFIPSEAKYLGEV